MKKRLLHLYKYNRWANERILELFNKQPDLPEKSVKLYAHLLSSERVWLLRLRGEDTSQIGIWPEINRKDWGKFSNENFEAYYEYIENLPEKNLESHITYRNSKGLEFKAVILDILTHVPMHGVYHRGQIAITLRQAGVAPISTDFITFVRQ